MICRPCKEDVHPRCPMFMVHRGASCPGLPLCDCHSLCTCQHRLPFNRRLLQPLAVFAWDFRQLPLPAAGRAYLPHLNLPTNIKVTGL
jgi:hypothetical protein